MSVQRTSAIVSSKTIIQGNTRIDAIILSSASIQRHIGTSRGATDPFLQILKKGGRFDDD